MLADKLHNLGSMLVDLDNGEDIWSRFNAPPDKILWYHQAMIAAAFQEDPRLAELADQCRTCVARLASLTSSDN